MALNISITSKYKPFTYEDYIKPLEGYWEDYDQHEEELEKINTDIATLRPIIEGMKESAEKTKYTTFLASLSAQADALTKNGLTDDNKRALTELKNNYASLMPRLALAEEAKRSASKEWAKEYNSGERFMDSANNPGALDVTAFLDGKTPLYSMGLSKAEVAKGAATAAAAYSSRIFNDPELTKEKLAGYDWIKQVEDRGLDIPIDEIKNNEQIQPLLDALYDEYGVKDKTDPYSQEVQNHIARNFWEGLVYERNTAYQQDKVQSDWKYLTKDDNYLYLIDKNNKIHTYPIALADDNLSSFDTHKKTQTEIKRAEDEWAFWNSGVQGVDYYSTKNATGAGKGTGKKHNEKFTQRYSGLFNAYKSSLNDYDNTPQRHRTRVISGNEQKWIEDAKKNSSDKESFAKYVKADNVVFFGSGQDIGKRNSETDSNEFPFGDNHITIVPISKITELIEQESTDGKMAILSDIYNNVGPTKAKQKMLQIFMPLLSGYINSDDKAALEEIISKYKNISIDAIRAIDAYRPTKMTRQLVVEIGKSTPPTQGQSRW